MLTRHFSERLFRFVIAMAFIVVAVGGCNKKNNPVSGDDAYQQADLTAIAQGRLWVYTSYSLDTTTGQKIAASVHREVSYVARSLTFAGKPCFLMLDSIYSTVGAVQRVDSSYLAVENGDVLQWNPDYALWLTIVKRSAGLGAQYTAGQYQGVQNGMPVTVTFNGFVTPQEQVVAPIGTVQAYKTAITVGFTFAGVSYGPYAYYFYLADGYGQVRMYTPVQNEIGSSMKALGEESLLVSKNF